MKGKAVWEREWTLHKPIPSTTRRTLNKLINFSSVITREPCFSHTELPAASSLCQSPPPPLCHFSGNLDLECSSTLFHLTLSYLSDSLGVFSGLDGQLCDHIIKSTIHTHTHTPRLTLHIPGREDS